MKSSFGPKTYGGIVAPSLWLLWVLLLDEPRSQAQSKVKSSIQYDTVAHVNPVTKTLSGTTRITVTAQPESSLVSPGLWVYSDRVSEVPSAMDLNTARWVFPGEKSLGATEINGVRVDGQVIKPTFVHTRNAIDAQDTFGSWMELPSLRQGTHVVEIRWQLRLPNRFGRLGYVGNVLTLASPWYPLIEDSSHDGLLAAEHKVELRATQPNASWKVLLGNQLQSLEQKSIKTVARGAYLPMMISSSWHRYTRKLDALHSLTIDSPYALFENRREGPQHETIRGFDPSEDTRMAVPSGLRDVNRVPMLQYLTEDALDVSRTFRTFLPNDPRQQRLHMVIIPSRLELSGHAETWAWTSSRAYEILPIKEARIFHHRGVKRAMYKWLARQAEIQDDIQLAAWQQEARGELWIQLDDARKHAHQNKVKDLVGLVAFHPMVDQLLYAPQMALADVYFGAYTAPDRYRDDPNAAWSAHTHGRAMARNLALHLTPEVWRKCLPKAFELTSDIASVCNVEGASRNWVRPHTGKLDYDVSVQPSAFDHRRKVYLTRIEIRQHRLPKTAYLRLDPIAYHVETKNGQTLDQVWDPLKTPSRFEIETSSEVERVEIDPHGELYEDPDFHDEHPKKDNATSQPWRMPLLQNFDASFSGPDGQFEGFVETALRKRYDLEDAYVVRLERTVRSVLGTLRYVRRFGPKVHLNRRTSYVSPGISTGRLTDNFVQGTAGGYRIDGILAAGIDTRDYFPDPRVGFALDVGLRAGAVKRDTGETTASASFKSSSGLFTPIGLRQTLVLIGNFAYTGGNPLVQELPSLGGPSLLRGYQQNQLIGNGRLMGVVEHRWTPVTDLALNAIHYGWIRELQIATFAGAGWVIEPYGSSPSSGASVGTGLRLQMDYGGVQPGLFAIDVAIPLINNTSGSPVGLYFGFEQYY